MSDDLTIQLFFLTSAVVAGFEAMKASGWRVGVFAALGGLFALSGITWTSIKGLSPPVASWISDIATSPQSWFVLIVLGLVLIAITGDRRRSVTTQIPAHTLPPIIRYFFRRSRLSSRNQPQAQALIQGGKSLSDDSARKVSSDLALLLHFSVDHATYHLLCGLIDSIPDCGGLAMMADRDSQLDKMEEFQNFVQRASGLFGRTDRGSAIINILNSAHFDAERQAKEIPLDDIPKGLDQLDFLKCKLIELQCERLRSFLIGQKNEKIDQIISARGILLQRMSDREES